jgi:tetratricopeptide (TPR) repeat protein
MRYLVLTVLAAVAGAQTVDFYGEGMKALDAQKYDSAVELFAKAIAADPADYAAHFNRGLAFSLQKKDADAVPEYTRALELKPGLPQAQKNLATSLENVGEAQIAARQFAEAEQSFKRALELNANSAQAELGLGRTIAREGRLQDAQAHYEKAVTLDASLKPALADMAAQYEAAKMPEGAIAIYRQFPEDPAAQERIGSLLLAAGKPDEAVTALEAAVQKSPTAANQLALAQAYVSTKQPAKAEPLAASALAAAPGDVDVRMFYGRLLRDQRKFPPAASQFLAAAQAKPAMVEAWSELAGALVLMEQYPQALAALDRVHALNAEIAGHFFLRGMVLDHLHQPKDAIVSYNQFLTLSQGKNPDQEFQARQRVKTLEHEVKK